MTIRNGAQILLQPMKGRSPFENATALLLASFPGPPGARPGSQPLGPPASFCR